MPTEEDLLAEHSEAITAMKTTISNGRWVISIVGSGVGLLLAFIGWVANDNLSGIRSDIKDVKILFQRIERDSDKLSVKVDYLEKWRTEVEEHIKLGNAEEHEHAKVRKSFDR